MNSQSRRDFALVSHVFAADLRANATRAGESRVGSGEPAPSGGSRPHGTQELAGAVSPECRILGTAHRVGSPRGAREPERRNVGPPSLPRFAVFCPLFTCFGIAPLRMYSRFSDHGEGKRTGTRSLQDEISLFRRIQKYGKGIRFRSSSVSGRRQSHAQHAVQHSCIKGQ